MSKKENLTRILLCVFMIAGTLGTISWINRPRVIDNNIMADSATVDTNKSVAYSNDYIIMDIDNKKADDSISFVEIDTVKNNVKEALINEVALYIRKQAPNASPTLAEHLVNCALTQNIDLCFMMGQTQLETNFGTTGMGRAHAKSMFGVMNRTYASYHAAINDYANILKSHYLVNGRTEHTLMNNYVTIGGHRYAGNTSYEVELKNYYTSIKANTNIYSLQQRYKKLL